MALFLIHCTVYIYFYLEATISDVINWINELTEGSNKSSRNKNEPIKDEISRQKRSDKYYPLFYFIYQTWNKMFLRNTKIVF